MIIYIDRFTGNLKKKNFIAMGPWCFDKIIDPIQIYKLMKRGRILKSNFSRNEMINSRKDYLLKNKKKIILYLKKKNKLFFLKKDLLFDFSYIALLKIYDLLYICNFYVNSLEKRFKKKKIVIIKFYKKIELTNIKTLNDLDFNSKNLNYVYSLILFLIEKKNNKLWKIIKLNNNYALKEKKFRDIFYYIVTGLYRFIKLSIIEKFFFSNVIEIYNVSFLKKIVLSKILNKKI